MNDRNHLDDLALLQRIIDRDQQALSELYERYSRPVFNLALYILQQRIYAEEVTQDVFFLVWRSPSKWNPGKGRFGSWLLSVTRYVAIDRLRRERRGGSIAEDSIEDLAHKLKDTTNTATHDDSELLRVLLKQLPKEQVQVILLSYFRGLSHEEVAQQLKIPPGTVKSRLRLGVSKLRELWREAVKQMEA